MVAGFAVFSVLGFMAHEQDVPIAEVAESGTMESHLIRSSFVNMPWSLCETLKEIKIQISDLSSCDLLKKSLICFVGAQGKPIKVLRWCHPVAS